MWAIRLKQKTCQRCEEAQLRRVNRKGFFERVVFPAAGFYPWECVICRRKTFVRDDGHDMFRDQSMRSSSLAASMGTNPSKPV
jgi:hypothetical protein